MNFLKRITSAGLSLAMAATIIPASAFAANDTAGAKKHYNSRRGARDNLSRFSNCFLPLRGFRQPLSRLGLHTGFMDRFHFEALLNHKSL
ncbi:MAG: hypothetical protein EGQ09_03505 [Clostridiales bacterium]|nr:hypothetical protein [Clostridiales bacterium]